MSPRPKLRPLPEAERRNALEEFLAVLEQDPDLAPFRVVVPPGPERQLALFAALERSVFRGSPTVAPPTADDPLDQLLCDVLDAIEREPKLKNRGAAYGADRHLANLQALGAWSGQPEATELFTTAFSHVSADGQSTLPAWEGNYSPASQVSGQNGELIALEIASSDAAGQGMQWTQVEGSPRFASEAEGQPPAAEPAESRGIIHHERQKPGEELAAVGLQPSAGVAKGGVAMVCDATSRPADGTYLRPLRRGRPPTLDDVAKGRVLGLMAFGLSLRQAAAQLGIHHTTLLCAMKRDEPFAQQVAEARLDAMSQPLLTVVQASRTNWRAAAWLAKFLSDRQARSYESTPEERKVAAMAQK